MPVHFGGDMQPVPMGDGFFIQLIVQDECGLSGLSAALSRGRNRNLEIPLRSVLAHAVI